MRNELIKKITSIVVMTTIVVGLAACGTKRKTEQKVNSAGEVVKTDAKGNELESDEETANETKTIITSSDGETIDLSKEQKKVEKESDGSVKYTLDDNSTVIIKKDGTVTITESNGETKAATAKTIESTTKKKSDKKKDTTSKTLNNTSKQTAKNEVTQQTTNKSTQATTAKPTQEPIQPTTAKPTQAPTQPTTPKPTQAPTQPVTQPTTQPVTEPQTTKPSYTGYRTDLDSIAAKKIVTLRSTGSAVIKNPVWNEHLYKVAQVRAKEIATNFSHNSDSDARSGYDVNEALVKFVIGSSTYNDIAQGAIDIWSNSPAHYDILMDGDQYAVACYQEGENVYWCFLSGNEYSYIAENIAATGAREWGQPGTAKYEENYKRYYNLAVAELGERKIW